MKKFAIVTNFNIYDKAQAAMQVSERLLELGGEVLISSVNKDRIFRMHKNRREYAYLPPEEIYAAADCVIVLGGDGSILDAARKAAPLDKPLLGINMGHLGYMAELEIGDLSELEKLICDEFEIDERLMLSVGVFTQSGGQRATSYALNDAVISNGSVARIVDLELYEGGELVSGYRADGMIVATPTGSTAYSMSAGGPITDPHLNCLLVTPVCPHSLTARPLMFRDDAVLEIKNVCQREKMLYLTVDGRNNFEIYRGDTVRITRSNMITRLIRLHGGGFYNRLQQKLNAHI